MTITINGHEVKAGDVWLTRDGSEALIGAINKPKEFCILGWVDDLPLAWDLLGYPCPRDMTHLKLTKPKPKTRKVYVGGGYVYYNFLIDVCSYSNEKRNETYLKLIETIPAHEIEVEYV